MNKAFSIVSLVGLLIVSAWIPEVEASRDRFVVVDARDVSENPQRYWSRGIVFEDELTHISGRTRREDGRTLIQLETLKAGRIYVDQHRAGSLDGKEVGHRYLFAGTILSRPGRSILFRRVTRYTVVIEAVEPLADEMDGDLVDVFFADEPERAAFKPIHQALVNAQNQLVTLSQNRGVEIADLFEIQEGQPDRIIEVSRVAVRAIEQELGVTSTELLSRLVRELLLLQYAPGLASEPEEEPEPEPEETEELHGENE